MTNHHSWPTQAIRSWLQHILFERFGHFFIIQTSCIGFIRLGLQNSAAFIEIASAPSTFTRADSDLPSTMWDAASEGWLAVLDKPLSAPGAETLPLPLIEQSESGCRIHYDILGLTYWMLSRLEEVGRIDLDEHGRFPATSSHAYKHDYLERPIVDEWLDILGQVIKRQWPELNLKQYTFSIKVSHDVDHTSRYAFCQPNQLIRRMAGDVLLRKQWVNALRAPWIWTTTRRELHPKDPYNTFDWLMDVSESNGLTSAFYFMTGVTDPSKDGNYDFDHPTTRYLMRRIHERGHEIGLHPSYNTYRNLQVLAAEADKLRDVMTKEGIMQPTLGGRMHYLRWEQPTTLGALVQAGLSYDNTLSYADCPGFRCGTCHEYPAFDPVSGEILNLRIRPMIAMECSVMADKYLGLSNGQEALKKFNELKTACQQVNGCFSLLWHNSEFLEDNNKAVYVSLVELN